MNGVCAHEVLLFIPLLQVLPVGFFSVGVESRHLHPEMRKMVWNSGLR